METLAVKSNYLTLIGLVLVALSVIWHKRRRR
jgi:LPXTG-motif cell wall-anchored protein